MPCIEKSKLRRSKLVWPALFISCLCVDGLYSQEQSTESDKFSQLAIAAPGNCFDVDFYGRLERKQIRLSTKKQDLVFPRTSAIIVHLRGEAFEGELSAEQNERLATLEKQLLDDPIWQELIKGPELSDPALPAKLDESYLERVYEILIPLQQKSLKRKLQFQAIRQLGISQWCEQTAIMDNATAKRCDQWIAGRMLKFQPEFEAARMECLSELKDALSAQQLESLEAVFGSSKNWFAADPFPLLIQADLQPQKLQTELIDLIGYSDECLGFTLEGNGVAMVEIGRSAATQLALLLEDGRFNDALLSSDQRAEIASAQRIPPEQEKQLQEKLAKFRADFAVGKDFDELMKEFNKIVRETDVDGIKRIEGVLIPFQLKLVRMIVLRGLMSQKGPWFVLSSVDSEDFELSRELRERIESVRKTSQEKLAKLENKTAGELWREFSKEFPDATKDLREKCPEFNIGQFSHPLFVFRIDRQ